jgi:Tautomerase enzyme
MPLVRFDLIEGRDERDLEALLDTTHEVLVSVFGIPVRDRYQVVQEQERCAIEPADVMVSTMNKSPKRVSRL